MRTVTVTYEIVGRETIEADIPKILAIFNGVPIVGIEVAK